MFDNGCIAFLYTFFKFANYSSKWELTEIHRETYQCTSTALHRNSINMLNNMGMGMEQVQT